MNTEQASKNIFKYVNILQVPSKFNPDSNEGILLKVGQGQIFLMTIMSVFYAFINWTVFMKDFQVFLSLAMSLLIFLYFRSLLVTSFHVFLGHSLGEAATYCESFIFTRPSTLLFFLDYQTKVFLYHVNIF